MKGRKDNSCFCIDNLFFRDIISAQGEFMATDQIRTAKTLSEVIGYFTKHYNEEILNGKVDANYETFLLEFRAIPFELRGEILYAQLVSIFGSKLIYHIPKDYKNEFLYYILEKYAESSKTTEGVQTIVLKNNKGSIVFLPSYQLFFSHASPQNILKIHKDSKAFMNLKAADFATPQLAEEYKSLIFAKLEYEKNKKLAEMKKEGIIKNFKTYVLTSKQAFLGNRVLKKVDKERKNVQTNDFLYSEGMGRLNKFKLRINEFKQQHSFVNGELGWELFDAFSLKQLLKFNWQEDDSFVKFIDNSKNRKLSEKRLAKWKYNQMKNVYLDLKAYWDKLNSDYKITEKEYKRFVSLIKSTLAKIDKVVNDVSMALDSVHYNALINKR